MDRILTLEYTKQIIPMMVFSYIKLNVHSLCFCAYHGAYPVNGKVKIVYGFLQSNFVFSKLP
jgi:hypothetical protein